MSKKNSIESADEQADLFPIDPEIKNLGVIEFKLKSGAVIGEFQAATLAADLSQLTPDEWGKAAAGWMVRLFSGDLHKCQAALDSAHSEFWAEHQAREKDSEIGYARTRNSFGLTS